MQRNYPINKKLTIKLQDFQVIFINQKVVIIIFYIFHLEKNDF